jgi:hypothetical protein
MSDDLFDKAYEQINERHIEGIMEDEALRIERPRRYAIFKSAPEFKADSISGNLPF